MSFQIILTKQAKKDLTEIYNYIAIKLCSPQNAEGQLLRLEKEIFSLDEMPERFHLYNNAKWRERNLRIMPVDNYAVLYIPNIEEKTVTILRVMYGSRDIEKQLG